MKVIQDDGITMNYLFQCDGMLTLECQTPNLPKLNKDQASELTALVSKDLHALLKITDQAAMVVCGAAFPTEQLLQPKFPIQTHISQYASAAFQGEMNAGQVLSIGAKNGSMPAGLEPHASQQNLLHLPFCLYTNDDQLAELFESSLMHKGMVSPPTYECLNRLLNPTGINTINHANYMTYLDLVAMMHNHYEQMGLSHLWQVIETALVGKDPKTAVQTSTNNHFYLVDHLLFTPYFSWSQYSQFFQTNDSQDYINWLMAQRLSLGAFTAHGLEIKAFKASQWPISQDKVCLGQFEQQRIKSSYWSETAVHSDDHPDMMVIHQDEHAGVVAISAPNPFDQNIEIHYPVTPQGVAMIEEHILQSMGDDMTKTTQAFADNLNWLL